MKRFCFFSFYLFFFFVQLLLADDESVADYSNRVEVQVAVHEDSQDS